LEGGLNTYLYGLAGPFRFIDPLGLYPGETFGYVDSNPLLYSDELGLAPSCGKRGRKNISTEGFNKKSKPSDVAKALKDALGKKQAARAAALRALLKVIKRGGSMMLIIDLSDILRQLCVQGDVNACSTYCAFNPDDSECNSCPLCMT